MATSKDSSPAPALSTPNQQLLDSFLSYMQAERGYSANTVAAYVRNIARLGTWLGGRSFAEVRSVEMQQIIAGLLIKGANGEAARLYRAAMRSFYEFLIDEGVVKANPTRGLPIPKQWKRVGRTLTEQEFEKMLALLGDSPSDVRDRAMLLMFYSSGLRVSELVRLRLEDVDLKERSVKVWHGKGNKDGVVGISPSAAAALGHYLKSVRPTSAKGRDGASTLFLSRQGGELTRQRVFQCIRDLGRKALGRKVSPHNLRHGCCTYLLQHGVDLLNVKALMRHSSVETTLRYTHLDLDYLRRIFYDSHPRARLGKH